MLHSEVQGVIVGQPAKYCTAHLLKRTDYYNELALTRIDNAVKLLTGSFFSIQSIASASFGLAS